MVLPGDPDFTAPRERKMPAIVQRAERWSRDPGISEMIEFLDHEKYYRNWDALTPDMVRQIAAETQKCILDFEYAARNYFKIKIKSGEQILFSLWESQELILDEIYRIRAAGRAQKIIILKARQLGAVHPETKVLTADLRWVPIDSLQVGDRVMSTDEYTFGRGAGRKMRSAEILDKWEVVKPSFTITLSDGRKIIATDDHKFLCKARGGVHTRWMELGKMRVGDEIRSMTDAPWDGGGYEDGWFGGLLDGEGSFRFGKVNGGSEVCVSQILGPVYDRAKAYLDSRGYTYREELDDRDPGTTSKFGTKAVGKLVLHRTRELLKLASQTRPSKILASGFLIGRELPGNGWLKVVSIEPAGTQRMVDIRTSTHTFVAEGLVTHNCSTLIEALIAWRTMFFKNTNSLIISYSPKHAAYLFSMVQNIYDNLPWWLQPEVASREFQDAMIFDRRNYEDRNRNPGLNSQIMVQSATQESGVGQGVTVQGVHVSEFSDWNQDKARDIIEGDLKYAIPDNPSVFAVLESTGKGAGNYSHKLWMKNVELAERADWTPLFFPWFFEKTRVMAPPQGWRPPRLEEAMRERVSSEWVQCDSEDCGRWQFAVHHGESMLGVTCRHCLKGTYRAYFLNDRQLYFMETQRLNAEKDEESQKNLKQELATTPQEAFQLSGTSVFKQPLIDYANSTVRPPILMGSFDAQGRLHAHDPRTGKCFAQGCPHDHLYDENHVWIWELPEPGARYCMGGDVAEGLGGDYDYSVLNITRLAPMGGKDVQVAKYRCNTIEPTALAFQANYLGRMYNSALAAIEANKLDACAEFLRVRFAYPYIYQFANINAAKQRSLKWHWHTTASSKPRLVSHFTHWLNTKSVVIRSANGVEEMKTFTIDDFKTSMNARRGRHDDELIAIMISIYAGHGLDFDENLGFVPLPVSHEQQVQYAEWACNCHKCGHTWGCSNPEIVGFCPRCRAITWTAKRNIKPRVANSFEEIERADELRSHTRYEEQYTYAEDNPGARSGLDEMDFYQR